MGFEISFVDRAQNEFLERVLLAGDYRAAVVGRMGITDGIRNHIRLTALPCWSVPPLNSLLLILTASGIPQVDGDHLSCHRARAN
ncbi:hypothetical protein ASE26_07740 [Duganella sp. Root198D2]|nr:hypothetical protein ASD07_23540 [Duganella sp. Root336D2]KRB87270.1 hypothetical protein ASE26_07740 [Duganella sp. Root198D2]